VLESESNQEDENDKFNRVDVLVEDETGEKIIIEIQNNYQVDYYHRMLYGVSKVVCDYLEKGDHYDKIKKIYSVSIVYFDIGSGNDYVYFGNTEFIGKHTKDTLKLTPTQKKRYNKEKVGDIFPGYCLLRVESFNKVAKTPLDEWIHYLKTTKIPDSFTAQGLDEIREKQKIEDLPEEERKAYFRHLDQKSYEEGVIEHNRLEAKREGKAEGRYERDIEISKKLKISGMPFDQISEITNLSIEEIEKI
jgi:predicted transposase/invertase (TIGR01784 family)